MKKTNKIIAMGLCIMMCTDILAGCQRDSGTAGKDSQAAGGNTVTESSDQVIIKFVHKFPEEERLQFLKNVVEEFEKLNPGIKIEMSAYGDEEIKDKTRVLLGSDNAPDIFFTWSGERITQYVEAGNALDITKYLEEDSEWKENFNQSMLDCCLKENSYWAIPWDYTSKEVIYNKKIFKELDLKEPESWNELLEICQKIKDNSKYTPIAVGNQYSWVVCHYLTTLNSKLVPRDIITKNYTLEDTQYRDPGYIEALDMVKLLYDKGYTNSDINSCTWGMSQAMVQESKAAMIYEEVHNFRKYEKALGENWGYFDFPEVDGARGVKGYITGGPDVFMVNRSSKHPDEAVAFLKYLTSDEVQAEMVYNLGFLPTTAVELDSSRCMPQTLEIIEKNLKAPGVSEWLDCAINQTVADTYLIGCQTVFDNQDSASIMAQVSATAKEVADDK